MEWAYLKASANPGRSPPHLPANARQIMYAARPKILALTGAEKFVDSYFTQNLLPDFVEANPRLCADWDVVFDARGHFREPHTGRTVPLGTIDVRSYLGERPHLGPSVTLNANDRYPTSGPANRYRNILFIEKEGFGPLLQAAQIAERFDIAIMSTKGMSVTASRMLLDRLTPQIDRVLVLHDFDIAGFSIFGTLAKDGRRYVYDNRVNLVDLGLRLADIEAMALQSEPVAVGDRAARAARIKTLRRHGANQDEIEFLIGDGYRVELNAMTSRQFVDFIERKLTEYAVQKVVPDAEIIDVHARRLIEQRLAYQALVEFNQRLAIEVVGIALPEDIEVRLRDYLARHPSVAWDDALARIIADQPLRAREEGAA
jgi:hypothetical protein